MAINQNQINEIVEEVSSKLCLYLFDNEIINRTFIDSSLFLDNLYIIMNRFSSDLLIPKISVALLIKEIHIQNLNKIELDLNSVVSTLNNGFYFYTDLFFKFPILTDVNNKFVEEQVDFYCDSLMFNDIWLMLEDNKNNNEIINYIIVKHKLNNINIHDLKKIKLIIEHGKMGPSKIPRYSAIYQIYPNDMLNVTTLTENGNNINTVGFLTYLIEHIRDIGNQKLKVNNNVK